MLNKDRSLLIDSNVPYLLRYKIIQEAIITAKKLDGFVIESNKAASKTRYELFGIKKKQPLSII